MPNGCCMSGCDGEEYPGAGVRHDPDCWTHGEDKKMARGYRDEDPIDDPFADFDRDDAGPQTRSKRRGGFRKREADEGFEIKDVEVIRATGQAILVRGKGVSSDPFGMNDRAEETWFPLSQLHERSEVREVGDKGLLVITRWIAEQKKLV